MSLEQDLLLEKQQMLDAGKQQLIENVTYTIKRRHVEDAKIAKQYGLKLEEITDERKR